MWVNKPKDHQERGDIMYNPHYSKPRRSWWRWIATGKQPFREWSSNTPPPSPSLPYGGCAYDNYNHALSGTSATNRQIGWPFPQTASRSVPSYVSFGKQIKTTQADLAEEPDEEPAAGMMRRFIYNRPHVDGQVTMAPLAPLILTITTKILRWLWRTRLIVMSSRNVLYARWTLTVIAYIMPASQTQ